MRSGRDRTGHVDPARAHRDLGRVPIGRVRRSVLDVQEADAAAQPSDERCRVGAGDGRPVDVHLSEHIGSGQLEQALEGGHPIDASHRLELVVVVAEADAPCRRLDLCVRQLLGQLRDARLSHEPRGLDPRHDDGIDAQFRDLVEDALGVGAGRHRAVDAHAREAEVGGPAPRLGRRVVVERGVLHAEVAGEGDPLEHTGEIEGGGLPQRVELDGDGRGLAHGAS